MKRAATIQADYEVDLEAAVKRFGDHEDMSVGHVLGWLTQFADPDVPLGIRILEKTTYFNSTNIRNMTEQLAEMTFNLVKKRKLRRVAYVPVGKLGSGAGTVARVFREYLAGTKHRFVDMLELSKSAPGDWDAVIFIEDFSGTGDSLVEWWASVESVVLPLNVEIYVGLLVISDAAYAPIQSFAQVLAVEVLDGAANVLSPASAKLTAAEKARVKHYCEKSGAPMTFRDGYGSCGLLLAFKHGCPDNSLPILWYPDKKWKPLFHRNAI